jgi:hypothetical protein
MLLNTLNANFNANVTSHMCNRNNLQNLPFDTIILYVTQKEIFEQNQFGHKCFLK